MKFKNLNLTVKIVVGLSIALAVLVGATAFSIMKILDAQTHVNRVTGEISLRLAALEAQGEMIRDIQIRIRNIVLLDDPKPMRDELNKLQAVRIIYDDSEARLTRMFSDDESRDLIAELLKLRADAKPLTEQAIRFGLSNRNAEATKVLLEEISPNIEKRLRVLEMLIQQQKERAQETVSAAAAAHDWAAALTASIGVLAVLLSLTVGGVLLWFSLGIDSAAVVPGRDME